MPQQGAVGIHRRKNAPPLQSIQNIPYNRQRHARRHTAAERKNISLPQPFHLIQQALQLLRGNNRAGSIDLRFLSGAQLHIDSGIPLCFNQTFPHAPLFQQRPQMPAGISARQPEGEIRNTQSSKHYRLADPLSAKSHPGSGDTVYLTQLNSRAVQNIIQRRIQRNGINHRQSPSLFGNILSFLCQKVKRPPDIAKNFALFCLFMLHYSKPLCFLSGILA